MDPFHVKLNRITTSITNSLVDINKIRDNYRNRTIIFNLHMDTGKVETIIKNLQDELSKLNKEVETRGYEKRSTMSLSLFSSDSDDEESNRG